MGIPPNINIDPRLGKIAELLQQYKALTGGGAPPPGPGGTPPFLPPGTPSITPSQAPGPGPDVSGARAPTTGSMPLPTATPMRPGIQGSGPIGTLMGLLSQHFQKKDQEEHTEAENIAKRLIQAVNNQDWNTYYDIIHDKDSTKILNKVYKGWLQKIEEAHKPGEEPDPTMQGFETGVAKGMQESKGGQPQPGGMPPSQPPGATPAPSAQNTLGGYRLPGASPEQQMGGLATSANLQALKRDPARAVSPLTSAETRAAALGKEGLAMTPGLAAEMMKYQKEIQTATLNAQRAEMLLKTQTQRLLNEGVKGEADLKKYEQQYLKAVADRDAAQWRAQAAQARYKGTKNLSFANTARIKSTEQALAYLDAMTKEKRSFNKDDVTQLAQMLQAAGATSLARGLPTTWWGLHMGRMMGGQSSIEDVAAVRGAVQSHLDTLKQTAAELGATPTEAGGATDTPDDTEGAPDDTDIGTAEPQEGDEVPGPGGFIYKFDAKQNQYVNTHKKSPTP